MKLLKKGDKLKKGDVILVKNRIIVSITEDSIFTSCGRIGVNVHHSIRNSGEFIDSNDNNKFCIWYSIYDYWRADEKEALAYLI